MALQQFLATRDRLRVEVGLHRLVGQVGQGGRTVHDPSASLALPSGVATVAGSGQRSVLQHRLGHQQGPGQRVDATDVAVEEVVAVEALAAQLRVEVEASGGEPTGAEDLVERGSQIVDRVGELVGVPPVLGIAPVGVDRSEDAVVDRVGDLVVERVAES